MNNDTLAKRDLFDCEYCTAYPQTVSFIDVSVYDLANVSLFSTFVVSQAVLSS